ncbi:MAG TPA: plastocyanin/azurin family copper-binding protein [Gaiellaceae bacterium]|jgi:plastocyanin|nr:plastocyanin/azurin family copper-binding protein [Gaiellaceae bacterium]
MTRRALLFLIVLPALALGLAACGGGNEAATTGGGATTATGGGGGGEALQLAADPSGALKFDKTSLEATAGNVTIDFTNDSSLLHDVKLQGPGVDGEGTDKITGSSTSVTLDLQPGEYTFYCSVDGHRAAGMEGKLVVK